MYQTKARCLIDTNKSNDHNDGKTTAHLENGRKDQSWLFKALRLFLKTLLAGGATAAIAGTKSTGIVLGANDAIRIGVAGLHGRGGDHIKSFSGVKGVQIIYLIDPDKSTFDFRVKQVQYLGGNRAQTVQDVRQAREERTSMPSP